MLFELLDAEFGDIKTWVKGKLEDTVFIEHTEDNKLFSKADQFALLYGKVEKVLESMKTYPQFGKGGLPQYYIPNVQELIDTGILVPAKSIKLN